MNLRYTNNIPRIPQARNHETTLHNQLPRSGAQKGLLLPLFQSGQGIFIPATSVIVRGSASLRTRAGIVKGMFFSSVLGQFPEATRPADQGVNRIPKLQCCWPLFVCYARCEDYIKQARVFYAACGCPYPKHSTSALLKKRTCRTTIDF